MNDLENAINYFEDAIKETDEIIEDCSQALKAELLEQKTHFITAINALKKIESTKWVSVNDKLPEVDKYGEVYVLVCMDDEFIATTTYVKDDGFELWAESGEVTHWMPLPKPPESPVTDWTKNKDCKSAVIKTFGGQQ